MATTAIGLLHGLIITKARVPSFVVTLAGLLTWSGVVLILTTEASSVGTIRIQDEVVLGDRERLPAGLCGLGAAARRRSARTRLLELPKVRHAARARPLAQADRRHRRSRSSRSALVGALAVWYANKDRGVPVVAVIVGVFLVFWTFVADPDALRPPRLRGRRQPRGGAPRRASTSTGSGSRCS